jgi:probable F420-dependent oxidoreductase
MAIVRPLRFGAKATRATSAKEWADLARQAEDLGYASLQMDDHFDPQLAPIPALAVAASVTSTIKLGTLVAGVDFRNPVVLAKEAATIDLLSGGRFMLGIGAGWNKVDYAIAGIVQDPAVIRIERLGEAITIMRGLWGSEPFGFEGTHYTIAEHDGLPKPVSHIPVLVGGGGRQILGLAAREADIVGVNPMIVGASINPRSMATSAASVVDERIEWIREAAGSRFGEIELALQVFVADVTDHPMAVAERMGTGFGLTPEAFLQAPYFQVGTIEQIVENIQGIRERWGISYIAFPRTATEAMAPIVAKLSGS